MLPDVAVGELGGRRERAGEDTATERGVGDDGDVELRAHFGDVVMEDSGVPEGKLDFDSGDGVDVVPKICSLGLTNAKVFVA